MGGKVILYYLTLIVFTGWSVNSLIRASRDLCRRASRDYQNPNRRGDDATKDKA